MMWKTVCYNFIVCILLNFNAFAQSASLNSKIDLIAKDAKGTVAVSILNFETRNGFAYNSNLHLPMQSVMKFPIAITVLHEIDEGHFTLDQLIQITKTDLPKTYSPLRDKYPEGSIAISIRALLSYMVSLSDNNACDILLKTVGGTEKVNSYVHSLGVKNIAVKASEFEMARLGMYSLPTGVMLQQLRNCWIWLSSRIFCLQQIMLICGKLCRKLQPDQISLKDFYRKM